MYEPVVILFLVISLAFVTRLAHEKERQRFALLLTILTLAWPWLLAAALVISAIGVAWIIAYAARIGLNRFVPRVRK